MTNGPIIRFCDCQLDLNLMELTRNGKLVEVEPQVFDLIKFFTQNAGRLVSRDDILEGVWGGRIVSDAAISSRINLARKAIGDDGKAQKIIKTIPRRGFRFLAEPDVIIAEVPTAAVADSSAPPAHPDLPEKPSIVVMPFTCLSTDPESQNLAQGLRIDTQNALVKVSGLFIIAVGSANVAFKLPQKAAAQMLGVQFFVQGQVRRAGEFVRLSVQLIDALENRILWSEQYDRKFEDTFKFIDELTSKILTAINVQLVVGEVARVWHKTLPDLKSLEVFYRGVDSFFRMNNESMKSARRDFENVAHHHPNLSIGPTWVSLTHWYELQRGWAKSPDKSRKLARQWAAKANSFEDCDGQAYTVLSHLCLLDRDFDAALEAGAAAVYNRPNCTHANGFYANVLHYCGRQDEALKHIRLAIRHSPIPPSLFKFVLASILRAKGKLEEATSLANEIMRTNGGDISALVLLTALAQEQGNSEKAKQHSREIQTIEADFSIAAYLARQPYRDENIPKGLRELLLKAGLL